MPPHLTHAISRSVCAAPVQRIWLQPPYRTYWLLTNVALAWRDHHKKVRPKRKTRYAVHDGGEHKNAHLRVVFGDVL